MQLPRLYLGVLATLLTVSHLRAELLDLYFGTSGGDGIHRAVLNEASGELTDFTKVADLKNAGFIAIHPSQDYLYSTAASGERNTHGLVAAFSINDDRTLSPLNTQSSEGFNACHVSIDATGSTLLVAN